MNKPILHVIVDNDAFRGHMNLMQKFGDAIKKIFGEKYHCFFSTRGIKEIEAENTTVVNLDLGYDKANIEDLIKYLEDIYVASKIDDMSILASPEVILNHLPVLMHHKEFARGNLKFSANAGIKTNGDQVIDGGISIVNETANRSSDFVIKNEDELDLTIAGLEYILQILKYKKSEMVVKE